MFSGENINLKKNAMIGLAAVAGFLLVVFIVTVSHQILKRKHKNER